MNTTTAAVTDPASASTSTSASASTSASTSACFAPCPRGLEEALVDELGEIGIASARVTAGGVHFAASWREVYRINLCSRLASRVLVRVAEGRYRGEDDIHRLASAYDWSRWFGIEHTLRIDTATGSGRQKSGLKSLEFVNLRIKDAICDGFRERVGARPSVERQHPDVRVFAYLDAHTCTIYLDTSGDALFKRGWRTEAGDAPLRENLAAGILRLAGWRPGTALLDPMCGSGSFVVEAAQTALGIMPGALRSFGFERLKNFDESAWRDVKAASTRAVEAGVGATVDAAFDEPAVAAASLIRGSDVSGDAVVLTRANLRRAGIPSDLADVIAPKQIDARQARPHAEQGLLITNPPYGERIAIRGERSSRGDQGNEDQLTAFFGELGDTLKQRFAGWTCHVLTSDMNLQKKLRLSPDRRVVLFNGAIECRLYRFPVVAGSHR
jgi:putative N6-adenine-specific DNA methylase